MRGTRINDPASAQVGARGAPAVCDRCGGYELVDSDGDGVFDAPCPVCRIGVERCPVHGRTLRGGRCASCAGEADAARSIIENHLLVGVAA